MRANRGMRRLAWAVVLLLVPTLTPAEVSVKLDRQGQVKRLVYLTRGEGARRVVWGQVRPGLPPALILNPLGDNLGDLPPALRLHPVTGAPWAVWSMNIANQKRIGWSTWTGSGWLTPAPVVAKPGPYYFDELDPSYVFDAGGAPFLVFWTAEPVAKVWFSTLRAGVWTPPLLLSDPAIDSRRPVIALDGASATVAWVTGSGPQSKSFETAVLIESAANLMDTPIPPGQDGKPGSQDPSGSDPSHTKGQPNQ